MSYTLASPQFGGSRPPSNGGRPPSKPPHQPSMSLTATDVANLGGLLASVPLWAGADQAVTHLHSGDVSSGLTLFGLSLASMGIQQAFYANAESPDAPLGPKK
jgi:hypothetical protein